MKKRSIAMAYLFVIFLILALIMGYLWFKLNRSSLREFNIKFETAEDIQFSGEYLDLIDCNCPIFNELSLQPGDVVTKYIRITNQEKVNLQYQFKFLADEQNHAYIKDHISFTVTRVDNEDESNSESFTILPNATHILKIDLKVLEMLGNEGQGQIFNFSIELFLKESKD